MKRKPEEGSENLENSKKSLIEGEEDEKMEEDEEMAIDDSDVNEDDGFPPIDRYAFADFVLEKYFQSKVDLNSDPLLLEEFRRDVMNTWLTKMIREKHAALEK